MISCCLKSCVTNNQYGCPRSTAITISNTGLPIHFLSKYSDCFSAEMDHCADGKHGCEQEFMSGEDSCVCACRDGFTLRPDGKTCQSESKPRHSQVFSTQVQLLCDIFI